MILAALAAAWFAVAGLFAAIVGRAIRNADRHAARPLWNVPDTVEDLHAEL